MLSIPFIFVQSTSHPTYALCDTPFVTYINCYMFQHRGVIVRKSYKPTCQ